MASSLRGSAIPTKPPSSQTLSTNQKNQLLASTMYNFVRNKIYSRPSNILETIPHKPFSPSLYTDSLKYRLYHTSQIQTSPFVIPPSSLTIPPSNDIYPPSSSIPLPPSHDRNAKKPLNANPSQSLLAKYNPSPSSNTHPTSSNNSPAIFPSFLPLTTSPSPHPVRYVTTPMQKIRLMPDSPPNTARRKKLFLHLVRKNKADILESLIEFLQKNDLKDIIRWGGDRAILRKNFEKMFPGVGLNRSEDDPSEYELHFSEKTLLHLTLTPLDIKKRLNTSDDPLSTNRTFSTKSIQQLKGKENLFKKIDQQPSRPTRIEQQDTQRLEESINKETNRENPLSTARSRSSLKNYLENPLSNRSERSYDLPQLQNSSLTPSPAAELPSSFSKELKNFDGNNEEVFSHLKFFRKFPKKICRFLLDKCNLMELERGCTVFREGDSGDLMYIIVRGAVEISVQKKIGEQFYDVVVNSLYDGDHFGDLAMLATLKAFKQDKKSNPLTRSFNSRLSLKPNKNKGPQNLIQSCLRSATVRTTEHTTLLSLSHLHYRFIYNNILKKELEDKLEVLRLSAQFSCLEASLLLPLANALQEQSFKLGEEVIRRGERVVRLYLVARGKCEMLIGDIGEGRDDNNEGYLSKENINEMTEPDAQNLKMNGRKSFNSDENERINDDRKTLRLDEGECCETMCINGAESNGEIGKIEDKRRFNGNRNGFGGGSGRKIPIGCLTKGDLFCQRALLNNADLECKGLIFEKKFGVFSNLTIISDSNETLIYFIDKEKFDEIPFGLKETIKNILIEDQEFDDLNIVEMEAREKKWRSRTKKMYDDAIKRRKLKREFLI